MTTSSRLMRSGFLVIVAVSSALIITLPRLASAAHEPTHIESEPVSALTMQAALEEPGVVSKVFTNIANGFKALGRMILGWFQSLGRFLGLSSTGRPEGTACDKVSECAQGLVCLNTCFEEGECDVFDKLCTPIAAEGTTAISIKPLYASCGSDDLCTVGTACTRTCPKGTDCEVGNRCLAALDTDEVCEEASDCAQVCGTLPFPPIGPSAYRPVCQDNACHCLTEEVRPDLHIVACTDEAAEGLIVCPAGMRAACTDEGCVSGDCPVRLTCLTAPAYGGQCLRDLGCADVDCAAGSAPFCDLSDNRCRCRSSAAVTIQCSASADCQGISCEAGQTKACVGGVCACEKSTVIEEDFVCTSASQCPSNCPEDYNPACVDGACACQRTQENVPVSCTTIDDCGGVSCPEAFEKVCLDGTCSCTRTIVE